MDDHTTDPALSAFLRAPEADTARRELEIVLVDVARPIVRAIVRATFPPGERNSPPIDADDVEQTVLTTLTASLMRLRSPDPPSAIRSLPDYAAVVAYNTCHAVLRVRAPGRARLRAHMRYVLTHDAALQVIDAPGHRKLAGLKRWSGPPAPASAEAVEAAVARRACPSGWPRLGGSALARLLESLLDEIGGPCPLELLVDRLAVRFGGIDTERVPDHPGEPVARDPSPVESLDYRERLARLWREICALPPRQRQALLFNLRDESGAGVIELFPATDTASMLEIAQALDLSEADLARLWPTLPRDDQWIAERLGLTRRQVINLRKCARERLFRRLRASDDRTAAASRSIRSEAGVSASRTNARFGVGDPEA